MNKQMMRGREHMIRNEISILKKVSQGHDNIITLVDFFETMNNLYLITELATGGELFDRICEKGSFYETDAAKIIYTILDAVAYLHANDIVHRGKLAITIYILILILFFFYFRFEGIIYEIL